MKKKSLLLLLMALMSLISAPGQTMPNLSTSGSDYWYYIQFKNGGRVLSDMGAENNLVSASLVPGSNQQIWKIESAGSGTYTITSKAGNKIDWNTSSARYTSSTTGVSLVFRATTNPGFIPAWELQRSGGTNYLNLLDASALGSEIGEQLFAYDNNCLEFVPVKNVLQNQISTATTTLNSTPEGVNPGQYTTTWKTYLVNAISTAQDVYNAPASTDGDYVAAAAALNTAVANYLTSKNPITISTVGNEHWFYIQFKNGNSVIADQGAGNSLITATILPGTAAQLWKIEQTAVAGQHIITSKNGNKLAWSSTNSIFTSDASAAVSLIFTATTNPAFTPAWELRRANGTNYMNQSGGSTPGSLIGEQLFAYDNNCLVFIPVKEALPGLITTATSTLSGTTEGINPGQYTTTWRAYLNNAITLTQQVYNSPTSTEEDYITASLSLKETISNYLASQNPVTISSPGDEHWFYLQFKNGGSVIADKGTGNSVLTATLAPSATEQLWKVEQTTAPGQLTISCKSGNKLSWNTATSYYFTNATASNMAFRATTNPAFAPAWEIRRADGAKFLNMIGTAGPGNLIGEQDFAYDNNCIAFVPVKDVLLSQIGLAASTLSGTVEGINPGQYTSYQRTVLNDAKNSAQTAFDAPASTDADYIIATTALTSAINNYLASQNPVTISSPGNEHWYYIQFKNGGSVIADKGTGNSVLTATLAPSTTEQLWKVEQTTAPGQFTISSKSGNKLSWNAATSNYITNATASNMIFRATTNPAFTPAWEIRRADGTNYMHQISGIAAGSLIGEQLFAWDNNCLVFIPVKDILLNQINQAISTLSSTTEGLNQGQYTTKWRTYLNNAKNNAQLIYDAPTSIDTDYLTATSELTMAISTYLASQNPVIISTVGNEHWYYIQFKNGGNIIADQGAGNNLLTSGTSPVTTSKLWKVEQTNTAGQYTITCQTGNKLLWNSTNSVFTTDAANASNMIFTSTTNPAFAPAWELRRVEGTKYLNQSGNTNGSLIGEQLFGYDNNALAFIGLKDALLSVIDLATSTLSETLEGINPGQYTANWRTALTNAKNSAQSIYNATNSTDTDYATATSTLYDALNNYLRSKNPVTISTTGDEHWHYIQFKNGGSVISDRGLGNSLLTATLAPGTATQLWKVEQTPTAGEYIITCKSGNKLAWNATYSNYISNIINPAIMIFTATTNPTFTPAWELRRTDGSKYLNQGGTAGAGNVIGEQFFAYDNNTLVFLEKLAALRTVSVSTNVTGCSAVITGTTATSLTTDVRNVSVTATPNTNYKFVKWTNLLTNEDISSNNPYIYTGTDDITLVANFDISTDIQNIANDSVVVCKNADKQVIVICDTGITGSASISVYNSIGQKLILQKLAQRITTIKETLSPGIYIVRVNNGEKNITSKILIE